MAFILYSGYKKLQKYGRTIFSGIFNLLRNKEIDSILEEDEILKTNGFFFSRRANGLNIKLNDGEVYLRRKSSDYKVFKQIFIDGEYKPLIQIVNLNLIKIETIIDAGSNIGISARYFLSHFPNAKIICIEPDKNNCKILDINLEGKNNIKLYNKALWSKKEILFLTNKFRDGENWSFNISKNQQDSLSEVSSITIDDLIEENSLSTIDIFKIDIEGSEFELFKKWSSLEYLERTKIIAIEIHKDINSSQNIVEILRKYNFVLFEHSETLIGVNKNILGE